MSSLSIAALVSALTLTPSLELAPNSANAGPAANGNAKTAAPAVPNRRVGAGSGRSR